MFLLNSVRSKNGGWVLKSTSFSSNLLLFFFFSKPSQRSTSGFEGIESWQIELPLLWFWFNPVAANQLASQESTRWTRPAANLYQGSWETTPRTSKEDLRGSLAGERSDVTQIDFEINEAGSGCHSWFRSNGKNFWRPEQFFPPPCPRHIFERLVPQMPTKLRPSGSKFTKTMQQTTPSLSTTAK